MSKKQHTKDSSGFIFDVQSKTVRAQGSSSENMKEKIGAVRAIVPNRSNTEIVLVLQHFDNCVHRTVQAFMEGNASEVLKEWTVTGKKKKQKKKKPKASPGADPCGKSEGNWEKGGIAINGFHGNGAGPDCDSLDSLSEGNETGTAVGNEISNFSNQTLPGANAALRLQSRAASPPGRRVGPSLEKSLKDLQRCSVALARFRALLREEMENSLRKIKLSFADIHSCLMDREVALLAEMDKVKAEAMELLSLRQRRAEALRKLTESAPAMSEEQLLELRADIKHFVSERKFDEELGRAGRFGCDLSALRGSIGAFGQVSHPKLSYSSRSQSASALGSALGSGSASGSSPGSGSVPGSTSGSGLGLGSSGLGSSPRLGSGSAPDGAPGTSADPTEPPGPTPQPSQRSRTPGSAQRPPGIPQNPPKNPQNSPKNPQNPQNSQNPGNSRARRDTRRPRRSRPEGANS